MDNTEVVRRIYDLFSAGKLDEVRQLVAEDFEWTFPGPPALPWAGFYRGLPGFDRFFAIVADHIEVERFEVGEYIEADDRVIATGTSRARVLGTEARYDTHWVNVFTVTGGKISRLLDLYETATVVDALRSARR